jgi:hypothetical protein
LFAAEINSFANPYPFNKLPVISYIGEYLLNTNKGALGEYELEAFELNVLSLERTFAEKILALIRASYETDENLNELKAKIRHIYDVYKLCKQDSIITLLANKGSFFDILKKVQEDDSQNSQFSGEWSKKPLAEAILFKNLSTTLKKLELTYKNDFASLLFNDEELPNLLEIENELQKIIVLLKEFDQL